MGCNECRECIEKENENEIKKKDDNNRNKEMINDKEIIKDKIKYKFNYLELNDTLEAELEELLKNSVIKKEINLNANNVFQREDVQKENKDIIIKIKKQLKNYKSSMENYLMKRAIFLEKVGYLVRFSHEIAIYIFDKLLNKFKEEKGFHSIEANTIRLYFASWIKETLNEELFRKISKKKNIYDQVKEKIENKNENENEINSDNEKEFLIKLFPDIIKLYFHCFLADIRVDIKYAMENDIFNSENMIDILLTGLEGDKNILFTFLPGLHCNGRYFENSYIYVTTYPINNRNKFPFENPVFKNIESDITIEVDELNPNLNYNIKDVIKNGRKQVEFVLDPDLNWDKPNDNYYFFLIDSKTKQNYIVDNKLAYLPKGCYEVWKISINGKKIEKKFEKLIVKITNKEVI